MDSDPKVPLNDAIIVAIYKLIDDAQTGHRSPSHSDLEFRINRAGLTAADPIHQGQTVGKAKRVRAVLNWALENDVEAGGKLVVAILSLVRGHGGFRDTSPNYVGAEAIANAVSAFRAEGLELSLDGELRPIFLDGLSGLALSDALQSYVRRAKRGATDAALVTGTGKDLLEAIASHILVQREGSYSKDWNFPMLLGRTFMALEMVTPAHKPQSGEPPNRNIERAMYSLACAVNQLRNREGTGHGRPWSSSVTDEEARFAIEAMGIIGERLLSKHLSKK